MIDWIKKTQSVVFTDLRGHFAPANRHLFSYQYPMIEVGHAT